MSNRLPPMPRLRPRPGLSMGVPSKRSPTDTVAENSDTKRTKLNNEFQFCTQDGDSVSFFPVVKSLQHKKRRQDEVIEENDDHTSRLLMKNECKGRRKNSGSLVHSIPKFSQVRPTGRLAEVQKVLQSRLISKQQEKQRILEMQKDQPAPQRPVSNRDLKATNMLQNLMSLHTTVGSERSPTPPPKRQDTPPVATPPKRRGRKPNKDEICHVVTSESEESSKDSTLRTLLQEQQSMEVLPRLSEVTITSKIVSKSRSRSPEDSALDLSRSSGDRILRSTSPEIVEVPVDPQSVRYSSPSSVPPFLPFLHPADYERLESQLPPGYVYWPNLGVFVHPLAIPQQFTSPPASPHLKSSSPPNDENRSRSRLLHPKRPSDPHVPSASNPPNPGMSKGPGRRKRSTPYGQPSDNNTEVSICKFKFTGGAKPTLEEKKMLSVDSGGNFRYFSGSGEKTMRGFEYLPREVMQHNASIVTDKFTSLTADKIAKAQQRQKGGRSWGAVDLIGAFEAMPEAGERSGNPNGK